jgi:hypothetical protein
MHMYLVLFTYQISRAKHPYISYPCRQNDIPDEICGPQFELQDLIRRCKNLDKKENLKQKNRAVQECP